MRKKLLPSLLRRQVVMALDDPALVATLMKFRKRLSQLLHGSEGSHAQQLLFVRTDEYFHAAWWGPLA